MFHKIILRTESEFANDLVIKMQLKHSSINKDVAKRQSKITIQELINFTDILNDKFSLGGAERNFLNNYLNNVIKEIDLL